MGLVKFDKAANTQIKKIALIRVDEPEIKIHSPGKWFSNPLLFGGGIVGSFLSYYITIKPTEKKRSSVFLKAKDENFVFFSLAMVESLRQELTRGGYDFIYLKDQSIMRSKSAPNGVVEAKDIKDIQTDADAILFVMFYPSYACHRKKKGFKPSVFVHVRLYDSRSKSVIYARNINVCEIGGATNSIHILPDEKYTYNSFDVLIKNFDEAVQGIIDCQNKIAARIAEHLK